MTLSLRARCYLLLMIFMVGCFLLNFGMDLLHDWNADGPDPNDGADELHEFVFLGLGNLIVLPLVLWAGWFAARQMLRPVEDAAATARRISSGRLTERLPVPPVKDELRDLIESMNKAFDSYQQALSQIERFSANVAHQLRAPLAAMRTEGEVCLSRARTADDYRKALEANLERVNQMTRMTEQMLALAEIEQSEWASRLTRVDPGEVVDAVLNDFRPLAEDAGITIERVVESSHALRGDRELLYQMIANVLDNAIRFTPRGGTIRVTSTTDADGRLVIRIDDSGPGIPEAARETVFQRFEQGIHSDTTGSGLGLAIVAEIVHVHGGTVRAEASPLGGARIEVKLPALA